jgi:dienelactone hydrolase
VHAPDLFEGRTFAELDDGTAYAKEVGFAKIVERGRRAADDLPAELVDGGFSLGAVPAQMLAQTRPGARGALLFHAAIPTEEFGGPWPAGVPLQIHTMEDDELGDVDIARDLAATVEGAELFLYPGDRHLFTDRGLAAYDERAAALVSERVLRSLADVD